MAILFVALALVLNSGIYAENLSTRSATSSMDPFHPEQSSEQHLAEMMARANYHSETATYNERASLVEQNVSAWGESQRQRSTRWGEIASTGMTGVTNGTRATQTEHGHFTPANSGLLDADPLNLGESTNWEAAPDSERRAFRMTVERGSLREVNPDLTTTIENILDTALTGTDTFWAQFETPNGTYRMYLLDDSANDSVAVVVTEYGVTENVIGTCSASAPSPSDNVSINVSTGTLYGANGETDCPALETVSGQSGPLYFVGGDHVVGTYQFIADEPEDDFRDQLVEDYDGLIGGLIDTLTGDDVYEDDPSDGEPYTTTAVYSVSVETTYSDGRISYTRNQTLAPPGR